MSRLAESDSLVSSRVRCLFRGMPGVVCAAAILVSGCARYKPLPLPAAPDLAANPVVTAPASRFWPAGVKPHPFPPNGLDETSVITLAVFANPDLKAARLQAGVASAQLLQAGLLPDPVFNGGYATSTLQYGYSLGLSEDIQALITRGAARAGAAAHQKQVDLEILWQEWQVAEKARELFIQERANEQLEQVMTRTRDLFAERYEVDKKALEKGNVTLSTLSSDVALLTNAQTSLRQVDTQANLTRHQLNALLGIQPEVRLPLIGPSESGQISENQFQAAVGQLEHTRVDLLALQAGYASQEQSVRESILAQFPSMSAGVEQGRDPIEGIDYIGPNVSLTLPLFNRNRGKIAEQRATRALMQQTYQARLDQAVGDANQVWSEIAIMQRQMKELHAALPLLQNSATAMEKSFREGNTDASLYVGAESSLLTNQANAIRLRASIENAQSALRTLLGLPF
ncbi:MAG TPA: TolC family protein [Acidobacteriaceae bacterium]|nr:TolC family protein [Acidobacteriaceae bacterium]